MYCPRPKLGIWNFPVDHISDICLSEHQKNQKLCSNLQPKLILSKYKGFIEKKILQKIVHLIYPSHFGFNFFIHTSDTIFEKYFNPQKIDIKEKFTQQIQL